MCGLLAKSIFATVLLETKNPQNMYGMEVKILFTVAKKKEMDLLEGRKQ